LETAVTTRGTPAAKTFVFRAPPTAFNALRAAGVDVVNMANNHGMDYGLDGLTDTLRSANEAGFPTVGIGADDTEAFAPFVTSANGQRIAIFGATQVLDDELAAAWTAGPGKPGLASAKDVERLAAAIRAVRHSVDTVIVYLHWGVERETCPSAAQAGLVAPLVEAGADALVGGHAHVLQGAGWNADGVYVAYGLGNFVFYASGTGANTETGVLELTFQGRAVTAANWVPGRIVGGAPTPLTGAASTEALGRWNSLRDCTGLAGAAPW
ncbi:CapA family protein, partial [Frankia sp. EI5c]|uniref:CapA family protein n=1 Tax=Frankia sp. EI5c TaxID=683316 RepID=UPI001F5B4DC5